MSASPLCFTPATELARLIRTREVSATEVMEAHLARIEVVNPRLNAFVTLVPEQALAQARAADNDPRRGDDLPPLHGLPIGIKDLVRTIGIRTTFGSLLYKDHVPDFDDVSAARIKAAGAIIVGKTNTPEFGCGGGQTTNAVFGHTRNPYNTERACGSSSGGSGVVLAAGMVPLADGSDFGGSLRHPAGHCNVVGFRPSPGRVPTFPFPMGWFSLRTEGPMGRTVADAALLLSVQAGPDPRSPIAIPEPGRRFREPLGRDFKGVRVAWSRNFGYLPVDKSITAACDSQREAFEALGCIVEDDEPDIRGAIEAFKVLRAWRYSLEHGERIKAHRAEMNENLVWNTEEGFKLSGLDVARAEATRTEVYHRVREFLERYEYLITPVNPTPPLPIEQRAIKEIDGVKMGDYVDGAALKNSISLIGNPAIAVPAGFTPDGLPVGLQIIGRHHADFEVLQLAHAYEQATGVGKTRPPLDD